MSAEADRYISDLEAFKRKVFWPDFAFIAVKGGISALVGVIVGDKTNFIVGAAAGAGSFVLMDLINIKKIIYSDEVQQFVERFNAMSDSDKLYINHRITSLF